MEQISSLTSSAHHSTFSSSHQSPAAMSIRELVKIYDSYPAVAKVNLDIPVGTFYGLVGPNGAGKTTLLSMATGLLIPDSGHVFIHGHDLWKQPHEVKNMLGVLPDGLDTFDRLTGEELVVYAALLRGLDKQTARERAHNLLEAFDLPDDKKKLVNEYSAGMKKKINLACALVHNPELLVLDEPFESVDPLSANTIIDVLHSYCDNGGTIIFSSHVMATVEKLCSHVAIMDHGIIKASGTVKEVAQSMTLEQRFIELVGGKKHAQGLSWLTHTNN